MSKRMFIPDGTPVLVTEYYILTRRNIEMLNMVVCSATNVESCLCRKVPRAFLASYYQPDLRDMGLLPEGWQTLPADELDEPMLSTLPKPAVPERAEQLSLDEETDAME